ncbi:hypothetical protein TRVL_09721 [Trypanosoma vivax]|nr:hypothetical protein TRVL_09721 [Trypanosoma vivax]
MQSLSRPRIFTRCTTPAYRREYTMLENGEIIGSHCLVAIPRSGAVALSIADSAKMCSSSALLPVHCVLHYLHSRRSALLVGTLRSHPKCFEVPVLNCANSDSHRRSTLECFGAD